MRDHDAVLALLSDVRDLLYGIFLMLFAILLCLIGSLFDGWGILLTIISVLIGSGGLFYAWHGIHRHEVVEHDETQD